MLTNLFQSNEIPLLEQVVNFAQARQNVLAGNIANLDTPGYRTRDISPTEFQARLREAVEQSHRNPQNEMERAEMTHGGHFQAVKESLSGILRHDDCNVGLEQQIAEMSKNQLQHNLAVTLLTSQFQLLQAAISERA
ncbi:MAG: flagellar basal body rod protein FlgB [Planctomycetota bacterium]|nr:flagellar basal body rod protein FlgB [Planctomycetota bacterium]